MRHFVAVLSLLFAIPLALAAEPENAGQHFRDWEQHRGDATSRDLIGASDGQIIPLQTSRQTSEPCATVFGYLPYWVSADYLRYDLLTHIACFSVEVNSDGTLGNDHDWPWTEVINTAHANGVKIILVATLFGGNAIEALVSSETNKATFFANIKNKMLEGSADGLNIDFEGFDTSGWISYMPGFLSDLTDYLHQEIPGSEVSIAGPAVNWNDHWDLAGVAAVCDYIFIMGYDFYGSWSSTSGPSAPLIGGWINITDTVLNQYANVTQQNPKKLVLGVPYYGNHWTTIDDQPNSTTLDWLGSVTFATAYPESQTYGMQWDSSSQTPWYRWNDGHDGLDWSQVWFDSQESVALKFDLAEANNLRGVGMWALGYDGSRAELWEVIQQQFVEDCPRLRRFQTGLRHKE